MRIYATTEIEAQALQDKAHAHKIATDAAYAQSVSEGRTLRWAIPSREQDENGKPVGDWFIPIEADCLDVFTQAEQEGLDAEGKAFLAARDAPP